MVLSRFDAYGGLVGVVMRRLAVLLLVGCPSLVFGGTSVVVGLYQDSVAASDACYAAHGSSDCGSLSSGQKESCEGAGGDRGGSASNQFDDDGELTSYLYCTAVSCPDGQEFDDSGLCVSAGPAAGELATMKAATPGQLPDEVCHEGYVWESQGPVIRGADGQYNSVYAATDEACGESTQEGVTAEPNDDGCITGANGEVACYGGDHPENCGTVNGEMVCVEEFPPRECTLLPDGGYVCDKEADGKPLDAEGNEVQSDTELYNGDGESVEGYDYYSPETMDSSAIEYSAGGTQSADGTVTSSGGASGSSEMAKFCDDNPDANICKEHSWSAPGCGQAPECAGDPIACAAARAEWEQNCREKERQESLEQYAEGNQGVEDLGTVESMTEDATDSVDVSEAVGNVELDDSGFSDGEQCPAPKELTVLGQTFTIDYLPLCDLALSLRPFLLAIAAFVGLTVALRVGLQGGG